MNADLVSTDFENNIIGNILNLGKIEGFDWHCDLPFTQA